LPRQPRQPIPTRDPRQLRDEVARILRDTRVQRAELKASAWL
jgi:hypothetical protein